VSASFFRSLVLAAVTGSVLAAAAMLVAYAARPGLTLDMDKALPRKFASGFYDGERAGDTTFAWTSQRADIKLAELSRGRPWRCVIRFRGGRSDPATQPFVDLAADGIVATRVKATNDFQDATIVLPPRSSSGAVVTITSSVTLVPGPADPRPLGVQVDRITCHPDGMAWAPRASIRDAALTGAIFGAVFMLSGLTLGISLTGVLVLSVLQALALSAGPAPYVGFSGTMVWFAIGIGLATIVGLAILDRLRPVTVQRSARVAIVFSAAVLYLKLLGLLHPSKLPVDALFHAHRFEWVLAGKYFFTQPMPGGVTFPYAIGLYVFAAPWSLLTHDYVTLLRVVVCSAQAIAGALLYPVVVKAWGDRTAALTAVVLFNVVPLPYGLIGNANLTNTFGEAVALSAVATASLLFSGRLLPVVLLFLLCALAFLSHVSTFALLGVTLVTLAILYRTLGAASERRPAWSIAVVTIVSAVLAVVLYYGHFGDVYKNALRVRADATAQSQTELGMTPTSVRLPTASLAARITDAIGFAIAMIGWPILLLTVVGAWRSIKDGQRDRATLAVIAWAVAGAMFLGVALMRVEAPFQRYAAEFFGRVLLATFPAAVVLAARAAGWAWKQGPLFGLASASLVASAVVLGIHSWMGWFL
jgi:hypothetical protein